MTIVVSCSMLIPVNCLLLAAPHVPGRGSVLCLQDKRVRSACSATRHHFLQQPPYVRQLMSVVMWFQTVVQLAIRLSPALQLPAAYTCHLQHQQDLQLASGTCSSLCASWAWPERPRAAHLILTCTSAVMTVLSYCLSIHWPAAAVLSVA
jgi:hypothetical protein